jgi:hypothetical protein
MKKIVCGFLILMSIHASAARILRLPSYIRSWDGFERDPVKRTSNAPYVSGDTFRAFCDHVFDEATPFIDIDAIRPGDTVFLVANMVSYFFKAIYPHIKHPFVIVTHNRDNSLPGKFDAYLKDKKIIAWFAVHLDRSHPKLYAIPIGIQNRYWPHGKPEIFDEFAAQPIEKTILLLASCLSPTHPSRKQIYDHFRQMSYCSFMESKPLEEYLSDLRKSKFVISPRGYGIDCHRTWEALYMGAIPLVPSTTINSVYADLPVVIVNDWTVITQEYLEETWIEYSNKSFRMEKLYADYWLDLISEKAKPFKRVR